MESAGIVLIFAFLAYVGAGNFFANRYFGRRHGVRGRLGRGWASFDAGWPGAVCVSMTWPVSIFLDSVRDPELCAHQHHVLARDEARRRSERAEETLRRESGAGRY
jgi:hypothetical protein